MTLPDTFYLPSELANAGYVALYDETYNGGLGRGILPVWQFRHVLGQVRDAELRYGVLSDAVRFARPTVAPERGRTLFALPWLAAIDALLPADRHMGNVARMLIDYGVRDGAAAALRVVEACRLARPSRAAAVALPILEGAGIPVGTTPDDPRWKP